MRENKPPPPAGVEELAREAFDWGRVSLDEIAQALQISRATVAAYRAGERKLPAPVAKELAQWIRGRLEQGEKLAALLDAHSGV